MEGLFPAFGFIGTCDSEPFSHCSQRGSRLMGIKIKVGIGVTRLGNGHHSKRRQQMFWSPAWGSGSKKFFGDPDGVNLVSSYRVVLQHGEFRIVMAADLLAISEAVGELEDALFHLGDDLFHEYFGRWDEIEFPGSLKLADVPRRKIGNRRFGDEVGRKHWSLYLKVSRFVEPGSHGTHQ